LTFLFSFGVVHLLHRSIFQHDQVDVTSISEPLSHAAVSCSVFLSFFSAVFFSVISFWILHSPLSQSSLVQDMSEDTKTTIEEEASRLKAQCFETISAGRPSQVAYRQAVNRSLVNA
jgi:hypothetical protein